MMEARQRKRTDRKRCLLLLLLTVAAIGGIRLFARMQDEQAVTVQTVRLSAQTVRETAVCTGDIRASEGAEVYCSVPCVAGDVVVSVGDAVKEGDPLIAVDRTATLAVAVSAGLPGTDAALVSALPDTLVAPKDGVISALNVQSGDTMDTATPCAVISSGSGIEVAVAIKEAMLSGVCVGQRVTVSGVAFQKEQYSGTLSSIATSARTRLNGTTGETVVDAVVTLDPEEIDESLLVGLSAKAEIVKSEKEGVLLVPYECLGQSEDGSMFVYRLQGEQAVLTPVELGEESVNGAQALAGLSDGEELVVNPEQYAGARFPVHRQAE